MSSAKAIIDKIPVQTYEDKVTGVILELTLEEAEALYIIAHNIGGNSILRDSMAEGMINTLRSVLPQENINRANYIKYRFTGAGIDICN